MIDDELINHIENEIVAPMGNSCIHEFSIRIDVFGCRSGEEDDYGAYEIVLLVDGKEIRSADGDYTFEVLSNFEKAVGFKRESQ